MSPDITLLLHELLCLALFWTVFCRAVRSCDRVRTDVRAVFFLLGIVACAGIVAPLVWRVEPNWFELLLLGAVTSVQIVTARHWAHGVPDRFYKPGCAPDNRGKCDGSQP